MTRERRSDASVFIVECDAIIAVTASVIITGGIF